MVLHHNCGSSRFSSLEKGRTCPIGFLVECRENFCRASSGSLSSVFLLYAVRKGRDSILCALKCSCLTSPHGKVFTKMCIGWKCRETEVLQNLYSTYPNGDAISRHYFLLCCISSSAIFFLLSKELYKASFIVSKVLFV